MRRTVVVMPGDGIGNQKEYDPETKNEKVESPFYGK